MSVYDLKMKELRKMLQEFNHTLYGKTIFFLAYIIPVVIFITSITTLIVGIIQGCPVILANAIRLLCAFGVSFIIANIYFYSEIRKYCEYKERQEKKK